MEASAAMPMLAIEYITHELANNNSPLTALDIKNKILTIFGDKRMKGIQDDLIIRVIKFN